MERYLLSWTILASNIQFFFLHLFCHPFLFKLSRVTCNHWLSLDDVYSHKWCPSETFVYKFYNECVSPSHVKKSDFRSWYSFLIHLKVSVSARLRSHFGIYRRFKFLVSLCMYSSQTFAAIKSPTFIKLNSQLACLSYWGM